jgi:molybdopterin-guanine dinucleotide biosynthesis protein B
MVRLIRALTRRNYVVSVIEHVHARLDIGYQGRDSHKMREAGASQVALSSPRRFALMRELSNAAEMSFEEVLAYAAPCDLVLVEGFKREAFPKIEIRRDGAPSRQTLHGTFPQIVVIASDQPDIEKDPLPVFKLDDTGGITNFIVSHLGLK